MKKYNNLNKTTKILINILAIIFFELIIHFLTPIIGKYIRQVIVVLILLVLLLVLKKQKEKKLTSTNITNIIIIIGVLLRTVYIVNTPVWSRQHDVDYLDYEGHISYIEHIYRYGELPASNDWQYYHPPLHHLIGAAWLKINVILFDMPLKTNLESLQILTLLYTSLMLYVISRILARLKIKDKYKHLILLFFCVNPTMMILSGSLNNDCLEYLFQFIILLYTLKYYEESSTKNSVILGILIGLATLTKLNGIIMLGPVGLVFLYKLIKERKLRETVKNFSIVVLFTIIIGISYQVRNYILFKTIEVPQPGLKDLSLYYSFFERMIIPSITDIYEKVFNAIEGDFNIFAVIVKSSLFGEWEFNISNSFYNIFVTVNLYLIIFSSILIIKNIKNMLKDKVTLLLISNHIILMLSYYYFNYKYPYFCTMDFRYIVPTMLTGIILLVEKCDLEKRKTIKHLIDIPILLFIVLSVIFIFKI